MVHQADARQSAGLRLHWKMQHRETRGEKQEKGLRGRKVGKENGNHPNAHKWEDGSTAVYS